MPKNLGPSVYGARLAKDLLLEIEQHADDPSSSEEDHLQLAAALLTRALADHRTRPGLILGLCEYLSASLSGAPIDPHTWTPLSSFDRLQRVDPPALKRY